MAEIETKVLVLGGGPGGYVAAIRAGQRGLDTVLVEEAQLGGTCLNVGCIPSKALIHAADAFHAAFLQAGSGGSPFGLSAGAPQLDFAQTLAWKDAIVARLNGGVAALLKRGKVKILRGRGTMLDGKTCRVETDIGAETVRAEFVVLATGSEPAALPGLPFGGPVISSTEALSLPTVPGSLTVVGAGYIGLELGIAFAKLGAKVTVVEAAAQILPLYDAELTRPVMRRLAALGIEVSLNARATGLDLENALQVEVAGATRTIASDKILVAVGRRPRIEGWGLEQLDLTMTGRAIAISERCATSMRNVFAIGDVTGEPMLAHRAMAQGEMVADLIAGHPRVFDPVVVPAVCFTDPEIVAVGLSPDAARAAGHDPCTGLFPFQANGRAMTLGAEDGFVRVTARADNHVLLGIHAVGAGVSELASTFGLALEMGARLEDVAGTIHAHPTLGEAFHEASLKGLGAALHI